MSNLMHVSSIVLKFTNYFFAASLCTVLRLTVLNLMYCNVDLELKPGLRWHVFVCIRMHEQD